MADTLVQYEPLDIQNVIRCEWCKEGIESTLVRLGCFHAGCKTCLQRMFVDVKPGSNFNCPNCNADCTVPENGVEGFPVERLQAQVKDVMELVSTDYPYCSVCALGGEIIPSTHLCTTCSHHFCTKDAADHTTGNDHVVYDHEALQLGENLSKILNSKGTPCREHSLNSNPQLLKFFCKRCNASVCAECVTSKHEGHETQPIKEAAEKYKQLLKNKTAKITEEKATVRENITTLEKTLKEIDDNCTQWDAKSKKWGEEMKKTIDKIVEAKAKQIQEASTPQRKSLTEILQKQMTQIKTYEVAEQYMEIVQNFGSDFDILEDYEGHLKDMDKCLLHERKVQMSSGKFEVEHNSVEESEKVLNDLFDGVYDPYSTSMSTRSSGDAKSGPKKGSVVAYSVKCKWKSGCRDYVAMGSGNIVIAGIRDLELYGMDGEMKGLIECDEVRRVGDIEIFFDQIYITETEKREVLMLDFEGRVQRRVKLPPIENNRKGKLGLGIDKTNGDIFISSWDTYSIHRCPGDESVAKPFINIGLDGPLYLCVTSKHECIASNTDSHTVCKFNPWGRLMWEYGGEGTEDGELRRPSGICLDENDFLFISDFYNHRIHYVSPQGQMICLINLQQEKLKRPVDITFLDHCLVITQDDNTVRVFQKGKRKLDTAAIDSEFKPKVAKGRKNSYGDSPSNVSLISCDVLARWKTGSHDIMACNGKDILVKDTIRNMEWYGMDGEMKGTIECDEIRKAWDLQLFKGEIYVTELEKREVVVLNMKGRVQRRVELPPMEKNRRGKLGLGIDKTNGDMYISSWDTYSIHKCLGNERIAKPFVTTGLDGPLYMCVTSKHECIVSNTDANNVCKFNPAGHLMWEYGEEGSEDGNIRRPSGICLTDTDHLLIADFYNHRIHYVSPSGELLSYLSILDKITRPVAIAYANRALVITQSDNTIRVLHWPNA